MKKLLFIVVFLAFYVPSHADSLPVYPLGIEHGLSNNTVTTIFKDKFGFMWFGTLDGLNRFDGYTFKKFRNKINDGTSLPENTITALNEDLAGKLWVGTRKGIGILDSKTFRFSAVTYQPDNNPSARIQPLNKIINTLKTDAEGNVLIGATDAGFLICKKNTATATQVPLLSSGHKEWKYTVNAIAISSDHEVWLVVDNVGLCYYDRQAGVIKSKIDNLPFTTSLKQGPDGDLWIGTVAGLYTYNIKLNRLVHCEFQNKSLNNVKLFDFCFDKNKKLWLATDGIGVGIVDVFGSGKCDLLQQHNSGTLSSNAVSAIYEDEQSRKWIGTLRGGVNVIDLNKNQFKTITHEPYNNNSLVSNFTFSFCEDRARNIWIGTDGGGISVWNRGQNSFKQYVHAKDNDGSLNNDRVSSIIKDQSQRILIATFGGGVNRFNEQDNSFTNVPFKKVSNSKKAIWKLFMDAEEKIWATCLHGEKPGFDHERLFTYDEASKQFIPATFAVSSDVISIEDDNAGNLLLGSFKDLIQVNKKTGVSKVIQSNVTVRALHTSKNGMLWIGTHGKGLISYNRGNGKLTYYNENNGLPNNTILNIEEDKKGDLWLSTFNGLARFNPVKGRSENYYASDGLQSNQFNFNASGQLRSGELLFGGIKGFNIFHPDSIRKFNNFPSLLITGVSIENAPVTANNEFIKQAANIYDIEQIRLPYDKAILSMEYVALEYSLPEKIEYAYFMEGLDKSWNYVKNLRVLNYSRLREGKYTLHIKTTNAYGVWNTKEKMVHITVLPPWFRSWWAYFLYVMAVSTSIYGYIYYHKKENKLHYEVKLANSKVVHEKVLNEKKIEFFTNISHEFRTPLTLIVNPIKELLHNNGKNIDLIDLSSVYRNARRLLSLVDRLLLFRSTDNELAKLKEEWVNIDEVGHEVFLCFNNQAKSKKLNYHFNCESPGLVVYADREKMEIVLFNLLSNALKFTPDYGEVSMVIREQDQHIVILIKDTGQGIAAETGGHLFEKFYRSETIDRAAQSGFGIGLFLAKKYVDIHQGSLSYQSELGEGTIFTVMLPKAKVSDYKKAEIIIPAKPSSTFHILNESLIEDEEDVTAQSSAKDHVSELMDSVVQDKPAVLLIDDDIEIRQYLRNLLKECYTVYEASDTVEGFDIIMQVDPDIIVCDVVIKEFSGIEFCSKLKESPTFSHIPVILLTGSSSPEIKLKGIECGADDYITKPFENDLLIARIRSILKGRNTLKQFFYNEVTLKNNSLKIPEEYSHFLAKCIAIIEKHLEDELFSVVMFTKEMGMSRSNMFRKVKAISGLTIAEFIRYIRLRKAAELMIQTDLQIKEVAFKIGFQDVRYFREQFFKLFELNPSDFIRKYRKTFVKNYNLNASILSEKVRYQD